MNKGSSENPYLILIPTTFEAGFLHLEDLIARRWNANSPGDMSSGSKRALEYGITGFGLAAAGSGAALALSKSGLTSPDSPVILLGIAGTYHPERYPVGSAVIATSVRSIGIGVGSGALHQSAGKLGWAQGVPFSGSPDVYDLLETASPSFELDPNGGFLSVASASASMDEAKERSDAYPEAAGEEMEGFSVALACRNFARPFYMIRGISNVAGDRDKTNWKIKEALASVEVKLDQLLNFLEQKNENL